MNKPKPTVNKEIRGNPGKHALNVREPELIPGQPERPKVLRGLARQHWEYIVPLLEKAGILSQIEGTALAGYCQCYQRWVEAERKISRYGQVIYEFGTDERGRKVAVNGKKNPACTVAMENLQQMRMFLIEYGMTPSSRTRIHVPKIKAVGPDREQRAESYFDEKADDAGSSRSLLI